jgi:mRNA interferase MazF
MISYKQGDVVLVWFVFGDESGAKRRPVLVVSTDEYHRGRQEMIVVAITSNVDCLLTGDHLIQDWEMAGLLYPSVVTGIVRTIKQSMAHRRLGLLSLTDFHAVQAQLRRVLSL